MQTLIDDIRERLDGLELFRYIDEDWGQLDDYARPPAQYPCALVDIARVQIENTGRTTQTLIVTVLVRVADMRLSNSSQKAPEDQRELAKYPLELAQYVYAALHGWHKEDSAYGALSRTGLVRVRRDDGIRQYDISFSTVLKDTAAAVVIDNLADQVPETIVPVITAQAKR